MRNRKELESRLKDAYERAQRLSTRCKKSDNSYGNAETVEFELSVRTCIKESDEYRDVVRIIIEPNCPYYSSNGDDTARGYSNTNHGSCSNLTDASKEQLASHWWYVSNCTKALVTDEISVRDYTPRELNPW